VDDGKSTLISGCCTTPRRSSRIRLAAVERTSRARGEDYTNLALLTDGLRAEREQGITIDVAYRYFATPAASSSSPTPPGTSSTRNMVTGASTADLAIILVDARNGLTEQSRRHAFLATLLRVPHLVLAVNKMDLVGYDQAVFRRSPPSSPRSPPSSTSGTSPSSRSPPSTATTWSSAARTWPGTTGRRC
jgi:sulfate adenylyltransferase subunit 1 (EFTu-like GTPase family)